MQRLQTFLLSATIFLFLGAEFLHPVTALNQDLGRHLLLGKLILTTHHIPTTNLFSSTFPSFPFVNTHWLSEVLFSLLFPLDGVPGLLIMATILMAVTLGILIWESLKKSHVIPLSLIAFLGLNILAERTDIRPELFSFFLLSLSMVLLFRFRQTTQGKYLLPLPFLACIWVNLHIYFFIGVGVLGLFFLDHMITHRKELLTAIKHLSLPRITTYFLLLLILTAVATLINPHGLTGALYPLNFSQNYGYAIEENQNLFFLWGLFHKSTTVYFAIYSVLLLLTFWLERRRTTPIAWLLACTFIPLGMLAERNIPLLVFATFLPFTQYLSSRYTQLSTILCKRYPEHTVTAVLTGVLLSLFFSQLLFLTATKPLGIAIAPGADRAVAFLQKEHLHGPLFNNFDIGSYLAYRLYPTEKVFVDSRPEAYPASFFQNTYIPMQQNPDIFAAVDKKYQFNLIFFSHTDMTPWSQQFLHDILRNPTWKPVYLDEMVLILLKKTPQNAPILARYGMSRVQLHATLLSPSTATSLLQLANFYAIAALPSQQLETLKHALALHPTDCPTLSAVAALSQELQDPTAGIYQQQLQISCH